MQGSGQLVCGGLTEVRGEEDLDGLEVEALALVEELVETCHVLAAQLQRMLHCRRLQLQPARTTS